MSVRGGNSGPSQAKPPAAPAPAPAPPATTSPAPSAAPSAPTTAAAGAVTAAQVYQEVLAQGGSQEQAQVAAALVSGIESNGQLNDKNPTSTASGLFQFLTTTWDSNGGSQYAATAGSASLADQVSVFLHASQGNNFYPWAPDLGGSYNGSGSLTTPGAGSKVGNWIAANQSNFGAWAAGQPVPAAVANATAASGTTAAPLSSSPSDSVTIDGKTYTTPGGDANAAAQTSALSTMAATLSNYGFSGGDLQTLTSWAWGELTSNTDPSQIAIDIQTPGSAVYPIFEKQFPGFTAANQQLTSQGLQAVSVQEYQSYQTQATQMAQAAGLPPGFLNKENIGILVGGNVSSTELSNRLTDATTLAVNSTPEQQAMFNNYFGLNYNQSILSSDPMAFGQGANFAPTGHGPLTPGQIAALALDPNVAEPLIKQQIAAAQIGGAGATAGIGSISAATATQLAQAGISPSQATSAFQNLAVYAPLEAARPGMGGEASQGVVSPDQLATGQLLGNPAAERQLQTAIEVGKAPFSGGGGYSATSKGTAVGSANPNGTGNT